MEKLESQKEFLSKMLKLIPDLESNAEEISSVVFEYSDMEEYNIQKKKIVQLIYDKVIY